MAAEFVNSWNGALRLTDEEFALARRRNYTGPQCTVVLMEIGDEDSRDGATDEGIRMLTGLSDESESNEKRARTKLKGLKVEGPGGLKTMLKEALNDHFPSKSTKKDLQDIKWR